MAMQGPTGTELQCATQLIQSRRMGKVVRLFLEVVIDLLLPPREPHHSCFRLHMIEGFYILTNKNQLRTTMRNLAERPTDATRADLLLLASTLSSQASNANMLAGSPEGSSSPLETVGMPNFRRSWI